MPSQWDLDLATLFAERQPQMVNRGLPVEDVDGLLGRVTDMWVDGPGGWVFEWTQLAERYHETGDQALEHSARSDREADDGTVEHLGTAAITEGR